MENNIIENFEIYNNKNENLDDSLHQNEENKCN